MRFYRFVTVALMVMTAAASAEDAPLDRMTQKMKKDCEDKGGQFQLTSTDIKHSADDDTSTNLTNLRSGREAGTNAPLSNQASFTPGSKTAYHATGQCVTPGFHMEMTLPPPDGPRQILHLTHNGAEKH